MTPIEPPTPDDTPPPDRSTPLLRVIKGDPTPEEVAALVAVVTARAAGAAATRETPRRTRSEWAANHRKLRRTHRPGPGAWRAAALP